MRQSSITDYIHTLENPSGLLRTLGDIDVERDIYREIEMRAGNSAAIFTYLRGGQRRFLKCYVRPNPRLRDIYTYIEQNRPTLLPDVRLLRDELYIHSLSGDKGWVDIVEGEWSEGETLDSVIASAAKSGNRERLASLADSFDSLCRLLLAEEWAHGDLKPENIVVRSDDSLLLIDCDAMWIPEFTGQRAVELGTPGYRHPLRDDLHFDKRIDDYPMLIISASLRALSLEPELYKKYNTTDNIILSPAKIVDKDSPDHLEILNLFAHAGMAREYCMAGALASPFPEVESIRQFFEQIRISQAATPTSFVENGKWGFLDNAGMVVIAPFWDEVVEFSNDRAAVRLGEWWHFINPRGDVVIQGLIYGEMAEMLEIKEHTATLL